MKKVSKREKSQVIIEYLIIFAIIIVAMASIGFLPKIRSSFSTHYDQCVNTMLD